MISLSEHGASPRSLMTGLGYAGLIPFYLFAGLTWLPQFASADFVSRGFGLYALAILSFLAGSLWGSANVRRGTDKNQRLIISNGITVAGAASLLLASELTAAILLATLYLGLYFYEATSSDRGWYLRMRLNLTLGAMPAYLAYGAGLVLAG